MKQILIFIFCISFYSIFAFDGEIKLHYTNFNGGDFKVENVEWYFKKDKAKMVISMKDPNGTVSNSSFIPVKSKESLIIYSNTPAADGKNLYFEVPINKIEEHNKTDYRTEKTTETKSILGYDCTKYLVYTANSITEMWVTTSIDMDYGSWASFFKTNAEMQGLHMANLIGFPLESTTKSLAGNIIFQYSTESVTAKTLDDKEFSVPAGYVLNVSNR